MKVLIILGFTLACAMAGHHGNHGGHPMGPHMMRPTGRPMMWGQMGPHMMRPTGRPMMWNHMRPHMGPHMMRPTGRPMMPGNGMGPVDFWTHMKNAAAAWKKAQMASDEDETSLRDLFGAWGKHLSKLRDSYRKQMSMRPTGRPQSFLSNMHMRYKEAMKKLQAMRPTGRPMSAMKSRLSAYLSKLKSRWSKSKMAAKSQDDEDETALRDLFGAWGKHFSKIRDSYRKQMSMRPTGRPQSFLSNMHMRYKEAMKKLQAMRPTGRPASAMKSRFNAYLAKLKSRWSKSKMAAKSQDDEDETARFFGSWMDHFDGMKKHFGNKFSMRPTGRPQSFLKNMHMKYKEAMKKLQAMRSTGRPTVDVKKMYGDYLSKLKSWWSKSKMAAKSQDDEDETARVFGSWMKHFEAMRKHFNNQFSMRPTGRPQSFLNNMHMRFKEAMKKMQAMRPTGRPSRFSQMKAFWAKKFEARKNQAKTDEDETEILFKDKAMAHFAKLRKHFKNLLANHPTGRPSMLFKNFGPQFKKAFQKLHAMRPTGRPSSPEDKMIFNSIKQKIINFRKKMKQQILANKN